MYVWKLLTVMFVSTLFTGCGGSESPSLGDIEESESPRNAPSIADETPVEAVTGEVGSAIDSTSTSGDDLTDVPPVDSIENESGELQEVVEEIMEVIVEEGETAADKLIDETSGLKGLDKTTGAPKVPKLP